jgi:hypothetical protein
MSHLTSSIAFQLPVLLLLFLHTSQESYYFVTDAFQVDVIYRNNLPGRFHSKFSFQSTTVLSATNSKGFGQFKSNKNDNSDSINDDEEEGTSPSSSSLSVAAVVKVKKTYGKTAQAPIRDMIDQEGAMSDFFLCREEWHPVFRSLAGTDLPQATAEFLMNTINNNNVPKDDDMTKIDDDAALSVLPFEFSETSSPWKRNMNPIPTSDDDRNVVAKFLDAMHQSLLDIPVKEQFILKKRNDDINIDENDTEEYDENDMHFVEEGRRLLALSRFVVIRSSQNDDNNNIDDDNDNISNKVISEQNDDDQSSPTMIQQQSSDAIERYDELFNICWSEVMELQQNDQAHTGSLILVPDYNLPELRRFTDMNLIRPLQWLGLQSNFEVVSMQRDSPAIRLLYKLNDIPSGEYTEQDGFAGVE